MHVVVVVNVDVLNTYLHCGKSPSQLLSANYSTVRQWLSLLSLLTAILQCGVPGYRNIPFTLERQESSLFLQQLFIFMVYFYKDQ